MKILRYGLEQMMILVFEQRLNQRKLAALARAEDQDRLTFEQTLFYCVLKDARYHYLGFQTQNIIIIGDYKGEMNHKLFIINKL